MSGHSHFSKIKHAKKITDAERGKVFSKMARLITIAAREGGGDPEKNFKLKDAIEKARAFNVPAANIERAIKRGTGEAEEEKLEEILLEAYGSGKIALMIEVITDNKNRALAEVKQILSRHQGKLAGEGSVRWLFEQKGVINIAINHQLSAINREELELKVIEAGAEDLKWREGTLEIYTKAEDLNKVKKRLEKEEVQIESAALEWVAKDEITVESKEKESAEKLFEALDENDAVQEIYSNLQA